MRDLLKRIRRANPPPFPSMLAQAARAAYARNAEVLDLPRAPLARVEELALPASDGTRLNARLYAATRERSPVLLYLHGGGFTIGSTDTHDSLCRQLAASSGAAVVSLNYRLAPEHRFPTAVDDAWAGMAWLRDEGESLGLDRSRLAVGGDSAGGTLAAVCALHARDLGLPLALQLLITPGTAANQDSASHRAYGEGFLLDAETVRWFFAHYIDAEDQRDWRFAPMNADDLERVAPACMVLAECDPLVDEGVAYADRLRMAGVAVELEIFRGVTHDFIKMGRALPEALTAQAMAAQALKKAFDDA